MTALVKGIGFGAVLVLSVVAGVLLWQRDLVSLRRLHLPAGWALAGVIALSLAAFHGGEAWLRSSVSLDDARVGPLDPSPGPWSVRWRAVVGIRAGLTGSGAPLDAAGPGRGLVVAGSGREVAGDANKCSSSGRDSGHGSGWRPPALGLGVVPLGLLALAPVKNAHYAISTQVPWSIWAALALSRLGERLRLRGL